MAGIVQVSIHSEINEFPSEKRFPSTLKIKELKEKLELITGANHATMKIEFSLDNKLIGSPSDDKKTLGEFLGEALSTESIFKLTVQDESSKDLLSGDVPKYTISEDKYLSRTENARNFIKEIREKRLSTDKTEVSPQ